MKLNFKDFLRKSQFPVLLAAGSMPLPMLVCGQVMQDKVPACMLVAAAYIAAAWLSMATPGKLRVPVGILLSAGVAALSAFVLPVMLSVSVCLIPLMYVLLLLGGLRMGGWGREQEVHSMVSAVCLVGHMIAQFFVNVDRQNNGGQLYAPVETALIVSFLIFAALEVLAMNRISLVTAVNGQSGLPRSMRLKNRLLTAGMMAVVLFVAALPAVIRAIEKAWEWIKYVFLMVLQFILSLLPEQSSTGAGGGGGMDMSMFGGGEREQSLLGIIIEKIVLALALLLAAVLLILALRVVWRKFKILLAKIRERLNAYMATSSEDYVDEIADTREDAQHDRTILRARKKLLKKRVDESALSPKERIRYRYLQLWLKHPEWTPERTARENLNETAAQLYERARYSTHDVTEREAESFAQQFDRRKG